MLKKVAVVIPCYRNTISAYEKIALQQCESILSAYPKIIIKPNHLTLSDETKIVSVSAIENFDEHYFASIAGYNRLMLTPEFYARFIDYEYILIYQLDAFVFSDELTYWCNADIDYIGAPWIRPTHDKSNIETLELKVKSYLYTRYNVHRKGLPSDKQFINKVGNGGFSLRRVKVFHDITLSMQPKIHFYLSSNNFHYNEDAFWSIEVNRKKRILNIPFYKTALKFAFEFHPERAYNLNHQQLPFGCHAWDKQVDFWRPIFKKYNFII
ncbi:MAG: hypothetical protein EOP45_01930 [Sphingobacteriaceae bacterium]|nr:MAG: hypothetical protein EOP45_01930 [Sphingobacteriaceae bacterium]